MKKVDSSSERVTVKEILYRDYLRLRNKGTGGIIASSVMLIALLYFIEFFGKFAWPKVNEMIDIYGIEKWKFYFFASWSTNICTFLIANLVYGIFYSLNHPFFEQYKIIKD
jgi:hypothetical protein